MQLDPLVDDSTFDVQIHQSREEYRMQLIRHMRVLVAVVLIGALSGGRPVLGQVRWRSGASAPSEKTRAEVRAVIASPALRDNAKHVVIQLDGPLTTASRSQLSNAGITVHSYLGDNAFFASVSEGGVNQAALSNVHSMLDARKVDADWKLHPILARLDTPDWAVVPVPADKAGDAMAADKTWFGAYIMFHADVTRAEATIVAESHDAVIRRNLISVNGMVIELPLENVAALAAEDAVMYLEPALPQLSEVNNSNRVITEADVVQAAPYDLDGTGVTVLVYDGGTARASHVDFQGRLSVRDNSGLANHATHVSGTIGGAGVANPTYKGMAPGVTIESYGFEQVGGLQPGFLYTDPGDMEADYGEAINVYGADISNNSIGTNTAPNGFPCEWTGDYGVTSTVIDSIVRGGLSGGEPFRIVWANGNERQTTRCGSLYQTTAPPACAKNHITVGALNSNDDSVTWFTSWGPADDGRLKPDVSAPGCQVGGDGGVTSCSSSSNTAYSTLCGTSMASPTVCGLSALLLQDFRMQFPGQPDFRNSTLKALLAHNAQDIEQVGPDYKTGYGSVRIQQTVDFMRTGAFKEDGVNQGESYSRIVVVGPSDPELRVTLAWDDPPGTPNVDPALVNDLDLRVVSPSGVRHYPWTLGGVANPAAPAVRTVEDHINNIEQVLVDNPETGAWTIEVLGFNVPQGPQVFSLVGDGASNEGTSITFPNGLPVALTDAVPTIIDVRVVAIGESLLPGSPTLHYRYSGGAFLNSPLAAVAGDIYQATFPAPVCGDAPEFYFSAEGTTSGVVLQPAAAPASTFSAVAGDAVAVFSDNFENDQGWFAENPGATTGDWQRGVPINDPLWAYDPIADSDGSGRCFVTQNSVGNTDVDGGSVRLTSPEFDLTGGNIIVKYDYFQYLTDTTSGLDNLVVEINGGAGPWIEIARHETNGGLTWRHNEIDQAELDAGGVVLTATTRIRFIATDAAPDSINESGLDAFGIISFQCGTVNGACCAPDGSCTARSAASCDSLAGTYHGNGSSCDPYPCPIPTGACCFSSGSCLMQSANDCEDNGGDYQGHDTSCAPNPCPQPTGACCDIHGICASRTAMGCAAIGGTYQGDGISCALSPCPAPRGACCDFEGSCGEEPEVDCLDNGSTYLGDGTLCTPNPCPQPQGACCQIDGTCFQESEIGCGITGGDYVGDGAECSPNACEQPEDACCLPDNTCENFTLTVCLAAGGTYQGFGSTCAMNPCATPNGACCQSDGACQAVADQAACDALGGAYQGDGTNCAAATCAVSGDVNCDGALDMNDVPPFVAVLLGVDTDPCHAAGADMTGDGVANGGDMQPFVGVLVGP